MGRTVPLSVVSLDNATLKWNMSANDQMVRLNCQCGVPKMKRIAGALLLLAGLTGCGTGLLPGPDTAALEQAPPVDATVSTDQAEAIALAVASVEVIVPRSLVVSEEDTFVPSADIVWRGDPPGDRHLQVAEIFLAAAKTVSGEVEPEGAAAAEADAAAPGLILSIEVTRFHGLTERARFTTGGNYAMRYIVTLRDAASGAVVAGPTHVKGDIKGSGGARAVSEDVSGRTEKVVVSERIVQVLRLTLAEMLQPES